MPDSKLARGAQWQTEALGGPGPEPLALPRQRRLGERPRPPRPAPETGGAEAAPSAGQAPDQLLERLPAPLAWGQRQRRLRWVCGGAAVARAPLRRGAREGRRPRRRYAGSRRRLPLFGSPILERPLRAPRAVDLLRLARLPPHAPRHAPRLGAPRRALRAVGLAPLEQVHGSDMSPATSPSSCFAARRKDGFLESSNHSRLSCARLAPRRHAAGGPAATDAPAASRPASSKATKAASGGHRLGGRAAGLPPWEGGGDHGQNSEQGIDGSTEQPPSLLFCVGSTSSMESELVFVGLRTLYSISKPKTP
ncbi:unnamed protein product [Prorocentrum cordatum]|uniref:Uncharacterized protein n=1 Tax=Prorocentrum cordatum TaxID=2364126 RepID=A0ABN9QJH5_9DINO|nr:unnamed protein product [Polarella glacialis]